MFSKISHVSFSARDCDRSAQWWREVFGFQDLEHVEGDGWKGIVMLHPTTATVIEFQQHDANRGERFDPARTGFDHLGFKVDDPAELDGWKAHFERLGVSHSPIAHREYGSVLTFKDPDGIQFEMFYREGHP
jgi:glyoxylase I family protein